MISSDVEDLRNIHEEMEDSEETSWLDYDGSDLEKLEKEGFKHAGYLSYLISPLAERNWFSDHYINCTAVVGMGRDAATGKELSFLSHQDPNFFINSGPENAARFAADMASSLEELRSRAQEGSVEVLLMGGDFSTQAVKTPDDKTATCRTQYIASIKVLREVVQKTLGFDPKVLAGPNNSKGETIVTVQTQGRKVWVERGKQDAIFDQPYQANQLEEMESKWLDHADK